MNLQIKHYAEISKEDWDNFVLSNSMGWAYHFYEVNAVEWNVKNINKSFGIVDTDNNEILFIISLFEDRSYPLLWHLFSRWGYVLKDSLTKKQVKEVKKVFENYIDQQIKYKIRPLRIDLSVLSEYMLSNKPLVNPVVNFNFSPRLRYTYVIDLSKSVDEMLMDCLPTTRNEIRRVSGSNLYDVVESDGSEEDCKLFIKMYQETYKRTHGKPLKSDYFEHIFTKLVPINIARVFFLENKKTKKKIASVIVIQYEKNKTAYYWWGGSINDKENGVNKFLLFKVMCIIRQAFNGQGFFETGAAWVDRYGKLKGLNDYKKSFGGTLLPIYGGWYCQKEPKGCSISNLFSIIYTLIQRLF